MPTYIKSTGSSTLWSWGNYRYTIGSEGVMNKMILADIYHITDTALAKEKDND